MMENLVESIEYYYDEDFSIPFDIGISEENNNLNINQEYNYYRCIDITDDEENDQDEYDNDELERVIMPEHIFSQFKSLQNYPQFHKSSHILRMKRSFDADIKPLESTQSAVRMSCSSSPNSNSSAANNGDGYSRLYFDSFTHNMSFIESNYSLKSRLPLFNQNNKNVHVNYHLHFAPEDSLITSSIHSKQGNSSSIYNQTHSPQTNATDSGKCSVSTTDSCFVHHLNEIPSVLFPGFNSSHLRTLKPDSILWRQIKYLMLYYFVGWSFLKLFKQFRRKSKRLSSSTDEIFTYRFRNSSKRCNRYSCSVLEMYNAFNDSDNRLETLLNPCLSTPISKQSNQNFSCQFPPRNKRQASKEEGTPTKTQKQAFDYPGIGKLSMPKQTRLNCSVFLSSNLNSQLSFLQSSLSNQSDTTYNRTNNNKNTESPKSMCSLQCQFRCDDKGDATPSLKPCLRKEDESSETKTITLRPTSQKSAAAAENFKRKSVSFDCPRMSSENLIQEMKEIPKKWGLNGTEAKSSSDMIAIFECGHRDSLVGVTGVHDIVVTDDIERFREMVNDVLRALKQISDRLAQSNRDSDISKAFHSQLNDLCDLISNGEGLDTPLATAIDNIITLLSDGLVATSFSSRKIRISTNSNKAAMRMWLFIEETCRASVNSVRKSELSQLLKDVRQVVSVMSSNKEYHVKLRAFVANSLKCGLSHIWLRSVVANEAALQRFYCPEAFLRQARTGQSDALAALTVSLKNLTSVHTSPNIRSPTQPSPIISKPVLPPPVKISRRFLPSASSNIIKLIHKPLYLSEETTESESYAEESRSSQSECAPNRDISNNNHSLFTRASTHPRIVKKSSTASSLHHPISIDTVKVNTGSRKPIKSQSNHSCNSTLTRPTAVVSIPMKTIRSQPLSSKPIKSPSKPDNIS